MSDGHNRGAALVLAMLAVFFLAAIGASLAIVTSTELRIAASYTDAMELRYAAEACSRSRSSRKLHGKCRLERPPCGVGAV